MSLPSELQKIRDDIRKYAMEYGLDFFEVIFEMVDADQINSLAALGGFPVRYPHWRFGMEYDQLSKGYTWGLQKIYEMVINTDPSYAYLLKSNGIVDQKTVIAHVYGHSDFFKNNYWFSKTNRRMLDTMANHAVKIRTFMDRHGQGPVEDFIDKCLSLENLIDAYLPFQPPKEKPDPFYGDDDEEANHLKQNSSQSGKLRSNRSYMDKFINPKEFLDEQEKKNTKEKVQAKKFPAEPEKDILLFLLEHAPLEKWQHEVLRIIRDEAYYFVPQRQTKIMNEGWASYWHSTIMTRKAATDSEIIDFADQHAGTMATSPGRLNPYKVGIELFRDIEDRWNKGKFGKDYDDCDDMVLKEKWDKKVGKGREKIFEVRKVCNDITFIDQYLTVEFVARHMMYSFEYNRRTNHYEIAEREFPKVKEKLLSGLTNMGQPFIFVSDGNFENRGELLLWHKHQGVDLDVNWAKETMTSLEALWGRPVNMETQIDGQKKLWSLVRGEFSEKLL